MIDDHGTNPEAAFEAFSEATTLDDLFARLDKCMEGGACGAAKDMIISSLNEVNNVRVTLGLKPFEHKDSDELELRRRRFLEIRQRELRHREMKQSESRAGNPASDNAPQRPSKKEQHSA